MKEQHITPLENIKKNFPNLNNYVVGIGASAGGLDALQEFFDNIPTNTGMAFCVVQHLSPDFKSLMNELLGRHSKLKIATVLDGEKIEPNRIYLNPNHCSIIIKDGEFKYIPKEPKGNINLPIDLFFHSLAKEYREKSIGIILSGTGTDGSRGIKTIKETGGTIMVQDPLSAQFDGMPNTAISTGLVEYIGSSTELAKQVVEFPKKPSFYGNVNKGATPSETEFIFNKILEEIYKKTGIDFKLYKNNTIVRRLEKRMGVVNISNISKYYDFIRKDDKEPEILKKDFFIGITGFFRDEMAWETLKNEVLPNLFLDNPPHKIIRSWVVACSTGQEAYSLAILYDEFIRENELNQDFKIFATDIDSSAIEIAARGEYIINEISDMPKERRENYFNKIGDRYQIIKRIRDKIVFSSHNIINNPPFIKMDFISCRNLLIYLLPKTQHKIFEYFQFSLNLNGYLFLGNSENFNNDLGEFKIVNSKWRIYLQIFKSKKPLSLRQKIDIGGMELVNPQLRRPSNITKSKTSNKVSYLNYLSNTFAPKCIFIDADFNVLYINGDLQEFLKIPQGIFPHNLLKMLNKKLASIIRNGIRRLKEEKKTIVFKEIYTPLKNEEKIINLTFSKFEKDSSISIISFEEKKGKANKAIVYDRYELDEFSKQIIEDLELEVKGKQEEIQFVIEELETTNEELETTNEELQASNEELQGTNEELQSVNEELYTVNSELTSRNKELTDLNNDIDNLLNSTHIGTLFLDNKLNIRKFTPELRRHFNLKYSDIGRTINSFSHRFHDDRGKKGFVNDVKKVIETGKDIELEVTDLDGETFLKRIRPFKTENKIIDGVVITFVNITKIKKIESDLIKSNLSNKHILQELELLFDSMPGLVFCKDSENNYIKVNKILADSYKMDKSQLENKNLFELMSKEEAQASWNEDIEIIKSGKPKQNIIQTRTIENKIKWLNTNKILIRNDETNMCTILGVSIDVTELINTQNELNEAIEKLKQSNYELSQFAYITSHDLQEPLNSIIGFSDLLISKMEKKSDIKTNSYLKIIVDSANRMKILIKDILEFSRIGRDFTITIAPTKGIIENAINNLDSLINKRNAQIIINKLPKQIKGNEIELELLFQNLISNAIKFNENENPKVTISSKIEKDFIRFSIQDNGIGISPDQFLKIFEMFKRLNTNSNYEGTGIGLANCKKIAEQHDGKIWVESELGQGSNFIFTISKTLSE